ncbi:N-formylglutamate amidohydrolase [Rhodoligotrophos appendicifer]|uniref:N-formylglutamate amidohydrolase n=1 Tax=Rhodoligotrophos appendicifer TaxID=987056 RepID=UPI003D184F84
MRNPSHDNSVPAPHCVEWEGFEPCFEVDGNWGQSLLLLCDHARNTIPSHLGTLGLPDSELERHIAYDIGAEAVTRGLAARLGVPAVLSGFSRLLIDPNRGEDDPTLIMRLSDGAVIPGNARVDAAERELRLNLCYRPYHRAVAGALRRIRDGGVMPVVLSVHSFTPNWKGLPRPWHVGMLWHEDPRLSRGLIAALEREPGLIVGDNEPYSGELEGDTMNVHCTREGISHSLIEIRQDLIRDAPGQEEWVDRLARILPPLLADPAVTERFGPR